MTKAKIRLIAILEYDPDKCTYDEKTLTDKQKLQSDIDYYRTDVELLLEAANYVEVDGWLEDDSNTNCYSSPISKH